MKDHVELLSARRNDGFILKKTGELTENLSAVIELELTTWVKHVKWPQMGTDGEYVDEGFIEQKCEHACQQKWRGLHRSV